MSYGKSVVVVTRIWGKRSDEGSLLDSNHPNYSISVSGFPNLFMLAGPNTLPSGNSTLHGIECSVVYITRILHGLWAKKNDIRTEALSIMPRPEAEAQFNKSIQAKLRGLVYTNEVSTWYINKETGKNTLIWPDTQMSFWWNRCISSVRWDDWAIGSK